MKQCILHVGMPKTGTSSIQASLRYALTDPGFLYISLGRVSMLRSIITLFGQTPEKHHTHRGWSAAQIAQERKQLHQQLEKIIANAGNATLIFSAESCWGEMNSTEFVRIRNFMADRGYTVKVIGYIRPWKQWLESNFQQRIKYDLRSFQAIPINPRKLDYRERIQELEGVFGAEQVKIHLYDPQNFPAGCVVRDFCQQLRITFDFNRVRRVNDSLKLPAVQLLYTYRKLGLGYGGGRQVSMENHLLNQRLLQLDGPPLRFHSSLVESHLQKLDPQRPWLEQRLGGVFAEDIYKADDELCIRKEADLFDFSPATLDWLAAASHSAPVRATNRQEAALAVSAQMHRLRLLGSQEARFLRLKEHLTHTITQIRKWFW